MSDDSKLIRIKAAEIKKGMVLGNDVCSKSGAVLLAKDTILTDYAISKLLGWQIETVFVVAQEGLKRPEIKPVDPFTKEDNVFFDMYLQSVETIATLFEEMKSGVVPVESFQPIAEGILEQVLGVHGVLRRLRQVKSGDEYTFNHSMNVGIYSVLIGSWLKIGEEQLAQLAMAGLLHDAGKAKVASSILQKPGPLTPEEMTEVRRHTFYGYEMIENTKGLSVEVALAALQHHEREDGTGYPLSLDADEISPLAKIVAVADVYDAITSTRVYQAKRTPYAAMDIIIDESFRTLNPVVVQKFLSMITNYFLTDKVVLSNGQVGTIVYVNPSRPTRPLVQTKEGFIDLAKAPKLQIVDVIRQ